MNYDIVATGSGGNALILNDSIMVDCGVPYKVLGDRADKLCLVLLTHWHGDHFNEATVRRLANTRPALRFATPEWLIQPVMELGVDLNVIDPFLEEDFEFWCDYGDVKIRPEKLHHDVPNCGWHIDLGGEKIFYATDTGTLAGRAAKNYDWYFLEANYSEPEIEERIAAKKENGEFAYEYRVKQYHLSKEKADDWLYQNMGPTSRYIYMHCHREGNEDGQAEETDG